MVVRSGPWVGLGRGTHFAFLVGCAPGINRCLRSAAAGSELATRFSVHCAFPSCIQENQAPGLNTVRVVRLLAVFRFSRPTGLEPTKATSISF